MRASAPKRPSRVRLSFESLFGPGTQANLPLSRGPDGRYLSKDTWQFWCRYSALAKRISNHTNQGV